ncbi:MAG: hypothetical protein V7K18_07040 [Nostoc sp.]|uniref:hypothetical protein n=1 Tax=Nostoc sp. TaxID=1180 RepID=UPI002FF9929E
MVQKNETGCNYWTRERSHNISMIFKRLGANRWAGNNAITFHWVGLFGIAKRDNLGRLQAALYINKCICNTGLVLAQSQ